MAKKEITPKKKNPGGRPTLYTPELGDEICEAIENSARRMDHICDANIRFPDGTTFRKWLKKYEELRAKYALAKECQADSVADEMIEIAYDDSKDWKTIMDDDGKEKSIFVAESVNRSRLKVDTLKWHASKLAPKKYGDKKIEDDDDGKTLREAISTMKELASKCLKSV